jgi:hypothetical protein
MVTEITLTKEEARQVLALLPTVTGPEGVQYNNELRWALCERLDLSPASLLKTIARLRDKLTER